MNKELIKEVQNVVSEVDKTHRYSMSKIYSVHNKVFDKNEASQSCASCLIRKVNELKQWLSSKSTKETPNEEQPIKEKPKRKRKESEQDG